MVPIRERAGAAYRAFVDVLIAVEQALLQIGREVPQRGDLAHARAADARGAPTVLLCDGLVCDGYIYRYLWDDLAELLPVA